MIGVNDHTPPHEIMKKFIRHLGRRHKKYNTENRTENRQTIQYNMVQYNAV